MGKDGNVVVHEAKEIKNNPWVDCGIGGLIEKVQREVFKPYPTGINPLDDMIGGGFMAQQMVILTGKPGVGKSAFAQWLCESMAVSNEDFSAVFMCFEMSREQLQARSISRLAYERDNVNLPPLDILRGKGEWAKYALMYQELIQDKILYLGLGSGLDSAACDDVIKKIRDCIEYKLKCQKPAPIIVVDYIQLVRIAGKAETEAMGEVMEKLKSIAVEYNTIVMAVSAQNRTAINKNSNDMTSARGSSSIEYGCDLMLSLNHEKDEQTGKFRYEGNAKVIIQKPVKGRWVNSESEVTYYFDGEHMKFRTEVVGGTDAEKAIKKVTLEGVPLTKKYQKVANDLTLNL